MTTGVVAFDYAAWSARYPALAARVSGVAGAAYFAEAGLYCDNTPSSPVQDLPTRALFLNMLTAHIAALDLRSNAAQDNGTTVGRISSAGEGSVNVATELEGQLHGRAWFAQTQYGLAFWQSSAQYRTAFYVRGRTRPVDPYARMIFR